MEITILHDPHCAASRGFLDGLGVAIPQGPDVSVVIGSDAVRIVSDHDAAVALCPAFPGYPVALVTVHNVQHQLFFPESWQQVTAWAANPTPAEGMPTTMTKYEFSKRFEASEMMGILAIRLTDPAVGLFLQLMDYAQDVDLTDPNITSAIQYLVSINKLTQERATAILTP